MGLYVPLGWGTTRWHHSHRPMAGFSNTEDLRREIQALAAENEELKQLVQLLTENHDLRGILRNQHSENSSLLPVHESSRLDGQDHFGNQPFLDSGSFAPPTSFRISMQQPSPLMTPVGAGPIFMAQLPLPSGRLDSTPLSPHTPQMLTPPPLSPGDLSIGLPPQAPRARRMIQFQLPEFQSPPIARLNLQSPPIHLRSPGTPDSGMQGPGFMSPDGSGQDFSFRSGSSAGRLRGRGYCTECVVPFHPHILQDSLADSALSGRINQSGTSSDESAQNFSSSSAGPENQQSAAAGSSHDPESPQSTPHSPGLPFLSAPQFSPTDGTSSPAARSPYPATPQDILASFSSGQSSQSDYSSPRIPQQGYVPFSPNYMQSFSPSGFAYSPEICSQPPAGMSPAPYFSFPSSPQSTPVPPQPQTPSEPKTKTRGESDRQATSVTMKKSSKDSKQGNTERIVGEIAFQLDRRILSAIFPDRVRLYGFTVSNIPEKIRQNGSESQSGLSEDQRRSMMERYNKIMSQLKPLGYNPNSHPRFTEQIVNTYGILRERPDMRGTEGDVYNDIEYLRSIVQMTVPAQKHADCEMLLNCLHKLSQDDGKPLFIW